MAQILRPSSDVAAGGWTASAGGTLASNVDEPVGTGDATYIASPNSAGPNAATLALSAGVSPAAGTVTLRVRTGRSSIITGAMSVTAPKSLLRVSDQARTVVTAADLTYLGMFSVGANWSAIRWGYEEGGMTGRYVGGQLRLLCLSGYNAPPLYNNIPSIYEIVPPADGVLTTTRALMPSATFVRDWGPVADALPCLSSDGNRIRGLGWDAGLNACWAAYAPKYGHEHNPSISYVVFNDTTNVGTRYGPWRTAAHCKMTGGYMCPITSAFSAAHCGGAPMALGCATLSRNGSSAWGPIFIPTPRLATYATTPPDQVQSYDGEPINAPGGAHPRYSIPNPYVGMQYPYWAQRMRDDFTKVVKCAWGTTHAGNPDHDPLYPPYDTPTHGGHIDVITGPWSEAMDWWASMVMIETPTKQGLCYFSTIVGPTPGYPDPAHSWYGTKTCSHGHVDGRHDVSTAGDGTSSKMNAMHVYDLNQIAQVVAGTMTAETIRGVQHNLYPSPLSLVDFQDASMDDLFIGAFFDEVTGRLYLRERYGDSRGSYGYWGTGDNEPRSAIHVFQLAGGGNGSLSLLTGSVQASAPHPTTQSTNAVYTTLTPADITYLGIVKLPLDYNIGDPDNCIRFGFSSGQLITGRYVSGTLHLFLGMSQGNNYRAPVLEVIYDQTPNPVLASAGRLTPYAIWGQIQEADVKDANGPRMHSLHWDETNQCLFWTFDAFYSVEHNRTIGATTFTGTTVSTQYGPWRTSSPKRHTDGPIITIPVSERVYFDGHDKLSLGCDNSLNAINNWGHSLYSWLSTGILSVPESDYTNESVFGITTTPRMRSDMSNKMSRNATYKNCVYNDTSSYNCGAGVVLSGPLNVTSQMDLAQSVVWIKNATKHGVIFLSQMADVVNNAGFVSASYGGDTLPHVFYSTEKACCHGQIMGSNGGTGPHSPSLVPQLWFYDPATLIAAQTGAGGMTPYLAANSPSVSHKHLYDYSSNFAYDSQYYGQGMFYDHVSRLLFIMDATREVVAGQETIPIVHVLSVAN